MSGKTLNERILQAHDEIFEDVANGIVPRDVSSFAALHDYVDANQYGGLCDGDLSSLDEMVEVGNALQDALDEWIKSGALKTQQMDIDLTFRLSIEPDGDLSRESLMDALLNLAGVMEVQTEDGLYSLGTPDGESSEQQNRYLARITRGALSAVQIDGETVDFLA